MKKRDLWTGVTMIAAGLAFLAAAVFWDTEMRSLFAGFFGAWTVPGAIQIYKYAKWSSPKHRDEYQRRLEEEQIDLRDERKRMLREKSGQIAYIFGLLIAAVSITVFSFLGKLGVVDESASRLVILFLAGYMLFQFLAGQVVYWLLDKKY